jgi:hypothetical protein
VNEVLVRFNFASPISGTQKTDNVQPIRSAEETRPRHTNQTQAVA